MTVFQVKLCYNTSQYLLKLCSFCNQIFVFCNLSPFTCNYFRLWHGIISTCQNSRLDCVIMKDVFYWDTLYIACNVKKTVHFHKMTNMDLFWSHRIFGHRSSCVQNISWHFISFCNLLGIFHLLYARFQIVCCPLTIAFLVVVLMNLKEL